MAEAKDKRLAGREVGAPESVEQKKEQLPKPEVELGERLDFGEEEPERSGAREGEAEGTVAEPIPAMTPAGPAPVVKDPLMQEIESVLEEDLEEVYGTLPPDKQAEFRKKGEEVAGTIRAMIEGAKFSIKKALKLLYDWLKLIPGVNRFFLEQEAKIKGDKLALIARQASSERANKV